jgi:acyl transferase domain-containing protein/NADPH:quinone reductase-like Zn-dependent oxidoreductase/acyl carrier protein/NADP-dependent 3-hydroxy acid dehydrogenase YdfG
MRKVAIVATSFRMPGTTPAQFWDDLLAGRDLVTQVDSSRWSTAAYLHPSKSHPGTAYTFAAGSIGDVKGFDAGFFAISPREAALMDPQQRLLLEMSWETFENAGIRPSTVRGSQTGVYIGIATVDYSWRLADDIAAVDSSFATGNTSSIAANRLSYFYDLRGPSMAIDTACSSSLVAFHQACRAIATGEISQALTGAISLHLHPMGFVSFSKATMLSRRGRCRVFDASADGYVRSEGGGVFLLKDYEQAVADGNPIIAVVAHSAVNTDGRKSGLTVPSPAAQASLLIESYKEAGIEPWEIDYLEAHGTGTAVGDPIETRALGEALGQHRPKNQPLPIGSVKGNVGHLEAASGVAGLIKALNCLKFRVVPAHIGMDIPNPHIAFDELNLEVLTANRPLRPSGRLIVGVNSFGFGGANAHVILESHTNEAPATPALPKASPLPIVVSAKDAQALTVAARDLAEFIAAQPQSSLYDVAYQAVFGRERHAHCAVLFGTTPASIAEKLKQFADGAEQSGVECGTSLAAPMGAAFVYSGNGSQWAGMGSRLLADPTFRAAIREVDRLFSRYADYSLEAELAGKNGEGRYELTEIAQPALFALQVGVTVMLRRRGMVPVAVAGHSVGEVAAAWASGSLSLAAAVSVIHHRSALQGTTKGNGAMTAANLSEPLTRELLKELGLSETVSVAGINSCRSVTLAGPKSELERVERALVKRSVVHKRLGLDYAFHSSAMDGLFPELRRSLGHLEPDQATIPFHSTVTGARLEGKALNAEYWWRNIREPVLFEQAIRGMVNEGMNIFVEIGPHAVLHRYIQDCLADAGMTGRVMTTGARGDDSPQRIYSAANQALIAGASMDWQRLLPWRGRYVRLPNYPWQREPHWHTTTPASMGLLDRRQAHPLLGYSLTQAELSWESTLDTLRHPALADHVVGGATVFPAAGFAEVALAAGSLWQPGEVSEIEDLEIRAPLILGDEPSRIMRCSIDPRDGQLSIKSREQMSTEAWTLHVVGRVLREATPIRLNRELGTLPLRQPDFTAQSHGLLTQAAGLDYGPAFAAVSHGWVETAAEGSRAADNAAAHGAATPGATTPGATTPGASVLAVFDIPPTVGENIAEYHLHPCLVDCAFQLIIQLLRDAALDHSGVTFVPTRVGHLSFHSGLGAPHFARARLLTRGPHSVSAEFEVFDDQRRLIALLEEVRFRAVRLQRSSAEQIRYFEYGAIPRPLPSTPPATEALATEPLDAALSLCFADPDVRRAQRLYATEIDPLLDELCSRFDAEASRAAQADAAPTAAASDAPAEAQASAQDIWNSLIGDYPDFFSIVHAVGQVGMHLPADRPQSAHVTLPTLMRQVLGPALKLQIDAALRQRIVAAQSLLPEGRRFGVVEISEGAPVFASEICRALEFDRADCRFASNDVSSLEEARRLQERYPALDVAFMQDLPASGDCLLAVVTLDFFKLEDGLRALDCARAQLAPGGTLLLVGQHASRWLDFVFGRDAAWWSMSADGAPLGRQQPAAFWQERAESAGFTGLHLHQHVEDFACGAYLMVGTSAAAQPAAGSESRHWLLLSDAAGYSSQLADHLTAQLQKLGESVSRGVASEALALGTIIEDSVSTSGPLHGIVSLSGLNRRRADADAGALLQTQIARCSDVVALVQACEATQSRAQCCFVTANAALHLLPARAVSEKARRSALADAPLAGLTRTLMNEGFAGEVRWVDLETSEAAIEVTAAALARELKAQDGEQEVILTARGERYAQRLRPAGAPRAAQPLALPAEPRNARLGFTLPGQLRNLQWESYKRAIPAGDQVEVAVKATGLNFRDIMYALGLLSDEAVENGFAGSSLGLEFSGVVVGVGPAAKGFAPGDAVVGFAPYSFGDRVTTSAAALSAVPEGISFEAAATIPSTFFTAYYSLHHLARLQEGERILIHGAAGGVGIAAIQVAKWCGAEIFATAGSQEKRDFLRLLGVDHIFDSRNLDFADQILELTQGEGVDVVLNSLAGEAINRNLRVLKPFGRFLELGKRDFYENTRVGLRPFRNNLSYFGIDADQLMSQRPDLTQRLFAEVLALFEQGVLHPLPYRAFDATEVVDAFRHMQQSKHIGKIVVTYGNGVQGAHTAAKPDTRRLELSADATYLVTGGLSGFGLRTAEWLVDRGARHLVLLSRRGAPAPGSRGDSGAGSSADEAHTVLTRLERRGVDVRAVACDVTDRAALNTVLQQIARGTAPLRGIVHAAMVIEDGLIRDMSAAQIRRVLAPKVLGAQHLHDLTRGLPLDFFVLYSSATTLFGNPGQGNYVAANFALEALARLRRAQGLPATCVGWGAIDDVGYLARNAQIKEALQSRMGGAALQSSAALDALEGMIVADRSDLGVLDLEWRSLSRFLPSAASPKFSVLARAGGEGESEEEGTQDLRRLLLALPEEELQSTVIDLLKVEIGEILRIAPEKIDPNLSMQHMGLDSLMGVELAVAVENRFGTRLPVMALSDSPTVAKLANWIVSHLRGDEAAAAGSHEDTRIQVALVASQHAADVPAADIQQLADSLLTGSAAPNRRMIH